MTLGLQESRNRRRRRVRWAIAKWVIGLGAIVGAGVFAYDTGTTLAQREVAKLHKEITELSRRVAELEQQNTGLEADVILAKRKLEEAQRRYKADVPTGELAALLGRVRDKLNGGVELARLRFLVDSAQNKRECDSQATTKRFIVQTPLTTGANDSVSFADKRVTITALGEPSRNDAGKLEAWFDPAQPITLHFTLIGGRTTVAKGKLPLHASMVLDDSEYRYTATAGPRGFVQLTGDRCTYP